MSLNKIYTVPDYDIPTYTTKKKRKKKTKPVDEFAWSHTDIELTKRKNALMRQIENLQQERREVIKALKDREKLRNSGRLREVQLYALKLEDDCWYIGMSYDPVKRLLKHKKGKGAQWTRHHPPIEIHETRVTGKYIQDEAAKLEDDMTLEYAMKYGSMYVRGGGYVQAKPKWPEMVLDNERALY